MTKGERVVRVFLEKVKDGGGEEFRDEANVILVVEEFDEMDAVAVRSSQISTRGQLSCDITH